MKLRTAIFVATAASVLLISGCAEEASAPADEPVATILDDQLKVMDQARAVEGQLQVGKARADAAIDEQSN